MSRLRHIAKYDFNRYNNVYNKGRQLRFPFKSFMCAPFERPEQGDSDDEILERQAAQPKIPFSQIADFLPEVVPVGISGNCFERTKHADAMFIAFAEMEGRKTPERYILKFFPETPHHERNARREVLFSYLFVESGENLHVPKITMTVTPQGRKCVVRRFYRGSDGRLLLQGGEDLPAVTKSALTRNYALRYVLFGDLDFHNPGNIIFCRHSSLTPKVLLNIDGEDCLPDEESMLHLEDTNWKVGDAIPGSCRWRDELREELGADTFFEMLVESENPMFAFLRRQHTFEEMKKLPVSADMVNRALAARPYYEQLVRTFEVADVEMLQRGKCDFQQVLDRWEDHRKRRGAQLTLFQVATGDYR